MVYIIESLNPYEPLSIKKTEVRAGATISDYVASQYPLTKEFPTPTICLYNGEPVLRKRWKSVVLNDRDVVNFVACQGWELVAAIVIAVVVALAVTLLMPLPKVPGTTPESDPVYSLKGQGNSIRLGEPIECSYGRNRIYPSYASRPYYAYENNDQFQHSLLCIGQGEYDVDDVLIGDTSIDNYQEAFYEIVPPGEEVTLFPTNVFTSAEAGGQNLFGPNQDGYGVDGWVGPFPSNPAGTQTYVIQVDMAFPKGLYWLGTRGDMFAITVQIEVQRRLIDDAGDPLGPWETLTDDPYFSETGITTTPQRRTYSADVPLGRYEVRARRVNNFAEGTQYGNDVVWEGLRGWLQIEHDYGDITLLAVKIRATNNLNDRTQQLINVIATRKLPIRAANGSWSEPTATRSIVWAFVDMFKAQYGGRIDSDSFFDWDTLLELDALYTTRSEFFDWCFRDPITVWDAARIIAQVGRAVPLLSGSLITMKRDGPLSTPVAMFNQENITEGSFEWSVKLWDLDEQDCLRIEYTDTTTGYKQETVMCILPGGTSNHPRDLRLEGVQSRAHAYHEGLYRLACDRYLRENVTFETGLEGYIPVYGDLIAITHDVPRWGQGGYVVNAVRGPGDDYDLWLSEPLVWEEDTEHQILLRAKNGDVYGPYIVQQTQDSMQVIITSPQDIDFLLDGKTEPMLFMFGPVGEETKYMKVVRIEPQGKETIRVSAVNDAPIVHSFDSLTPPALEETPYAPIPPDLPEIDNLYLTAVDGTLQAVQVAWSAAFGATSYVVQTSIDGDNWTTRATTTRTSVTLAVEPGDLYVRVAGIGAGQGPWIQDVITIGAVSGLVIVTPWDALEWVATWFQTLNALGWQVKVYDNSGMSPVLKRTEDLLITDPRTYTYDYTKATADANLVREMLLSVDVKFEAIDGSGPELSGTPTLLEVSNSIPLPVTSLGSAVDAVNPTSVDYELSWIVPAGQGDLHRIKIWVEPASGFDPSVATPVYDYTAPSPGAGVLPSSQIVTVPLDSDGEHAAYYWRVGIFDVWGNEISTNVSAEQTIPAYP